MLWGLPDPGAACLPPLPDWLFLYKLKKKKTVAKASLGCVVQVVMGGQEAAASFRTAKEFIHRSWLCPSSLPNSARSRSGWDEPSQGMQRTRGGIDGEPWQCRAGTQNH